MLTPKLSEVIFFFLVLSAIPGPVEPRVQGGSLVPPILGPNKGKTFCSNSSIYYKRSVNFRSKFYFFHFFQKTYEIIF